MKRKLFFPILVLALLLAGCSNSDATSQLEGTIWKLVSYGSAGNLIPAVAEVETSLEFGENGELTGNLGCNHLSGIYQQTGDSIQVDSLMSTMMACDELRMQQESAAVSVLSGEIKLTFEGEILLLHNVSNNYQLQLIRQ